MQFLQFTYFQLYTKWSEFIVFPQLISEMHKRKKQSVWMKVKQKMDGIKSISAFIKWNTLIFIMAWFVCFFFNQKFVCPASVSTIFQFDPIFHVTFSETCYSNDIFAYIIIFELFNWNWFLLFTFMYHFEPVLWHLIFCLSFFVV